MRRLQFNLIDDDTIEMTTDRGNSYVINKETTLKEIGSEGLRIIRTIIKEEYETMMDILDEVAERK